MTFYDLGGPKYLQWLRLFHPSESEKIINNLLPPMHHDSVPSIGGKSVPKSGTYASVDPKSSSITNTHKYPTRCSVKGMGESNTKELSTEEQKVTYSKLIIDSSIDLCYC